MIYSPSDYTIPVIARYWKHSTSESDTRLCAFALCLFFCPDIGENKAYFRTHPPPPPSQILPRIYQGVGPTATSSTAKQAKALIAAFADHLWRLSGSVACTEIDFLILVFNQDDGEPEFLKVAMNFAPFWNSVFRLMRKMTKEPDEHDIQSAGGSMETAKRLRFDVMSYTLNLMVTMLLPYPSDKSRECEQVVRIWINEGLFSALEETIDSLVTIRGMTSKSIFHQVILGSSAFRSGVFTPVLYY